MSSVQSVLDQVESWLLRERRRRRLFATFDAEGRALTPRPLPSQGGGNENGNGEGGGGGDSGHYVPIAPGDQPGTGSQDTVTDDDGGGELPDNYTDGGIITRLQPDENVIGNTDYPDPRVGTGGGESIPGRLIADSIPTVATREAPTQLRTGIPTDHQLPSFAPDSAASSVTAASSTLASATVALTHREQSLADALGIDDDGAVSRLGYDATWTDSFLNGLIESQWLRRKGTWVEDGGFLDVTAIGVGVPQAILQLRTRDYSDVVLRGTLRTTPATSVYQLLARGRIDEEYSGYLCFRRSDGLVIISRVDDGASTSLGNVAQAAVAGDVLGFELDGDELRATWNGVTILTVNDATYTSGFVGLGAMNANFADFRTFDVSPLGK